MMYFGSNRATGENKANALAEFLDGTHDCYRGEKLEAGTPTPLNELARHFGRRAMGLFADHASAEQNALARLEESHGRRQTWTMIGPSSPQSTITDASGSWVWDLGRGLVLLAIQFWCMTTSIAYRVLSGLIGLIGPIRSDKLFSLIGSSDRHPSSREPTTNEPASQASKRHATWIECGVLMTSQSQSAPCKQQSLA